MHRNQTVIKCRWDASFGAQCFKCSVHSLRCSCMQSAGCFFPQYGHGVSYTRSGSPLCARLREQRRTKQVPTILVKLTPRRAPNTISEVCSCGQGVGLKLGLGLGLGDCVAAIADARHPKKVRTCDIILLSPENFLPVGQRTRAGYKGKLAVLVSTGHALASTGSAWPRRASPHWADGK